MPSLRSGCCRQLTRRPLTRCQLLLACVLLFAALAGSSAASAQVEPSRPEEGQIVRLYAAALDREPEPGGAGFWTNRLIEGESITSVAQFFVTSPEFQRRFSADTDEDFVDLVYGNVLGRPPDKQGRGYWLERLADGLGRQHLVVFFSESAEFAARTRTELPELPPFDARVDPVSIAVLGSSWREGCPVPISDLRILTLSRVRFDGGEDVGFLVVHADVADDVVDVFRQLYEARYPIERMELVNNFESDDNLSMEANNTSAFNCRPVTGGTGWSHHAYGWAIDINPLFNPYHRGSTILPPAGESYLDRAQYHPAFIREGDVVTRAFDAIGWRWGGRWNSLVDYQHFDR